MIFVTFSRLNKPDSLIDTIASNNGYRRKMPYPNLLTHSHTPNLEMLSHLKTALQVIWFSLGFCHSVVDFWYWFPYDVVFFMHGIALFGKLCSRLLALRLVRYSWYQPLSCCLTKLVDIFLYMRTSARDGFFGTFCIKINQFRFLKLILHIPSEHQSFFYDGFIWLIMIRVNWEEFLVSLNLITI